LNNPIESIEMSLLRNFKASAWTCAALLLASCGGGGGSAGTPAATALPQVTFAVSNGAGVSGSLVITLESEKAPATVANFLAYVKAGFYNGTVIHRNSPGFVLQGGGYAGPITAVLTASQLQAQHKPTNAPIVLEDGAGLSNLRYTMAMARTGAPDSATSEFFINLVDNTAGNRNNLDKTAIARGYAVFGTITAGTELVTAMAAAPCVAAASLSSPECLPVPNLTITSATQTR
jgi:peptidyl-prolyl cis-trans isomerase A (cyclophilin A)